MAPPRFWLRASLGCRYRDSPHQGACLNALDAIAAPPTSSYVNFAATAIKHNIGARLAPCFTFLSFASWHRFDATGLSSFSVLRPVQGAACPGCSRLLRSPRAPKISYRKAANAFLMGVIDLPAWTSTGLVACSRVPNGQCFEPSRSPFGDAVSGTDSFAEYQKGTDSSPNSLPAAVYISIA